MEKTFFEELIECMRWAKIIERKLDDLVSGMSPLVRRMEELAIMQIKSKEVDSGEYSVERYTHEAHGNLPLVKKYTLEQYFREGVEKYKNFPVRFIDYGQCGGQIEAWVCSPMIEDSDDE